MSGRAGALAPIRRLRALRPRRGFAWLGNHVALDFINTVAWRESDDPQEKLASYVDLIRWLCGARLLTEELGREARFLAKEAPGQASEVLDRAIKFREIAYSVIRSIAHGRKPASHGLALLNEHVSRLQKRNQIEWASGRFKWKAKNTNMTLDLMIPDLIWNVAMLLTESPYDRIKQCADDRGCGWLFLDDRKNNSRRWCSSSDCGNRAKVLEHYRRKRNRRSGRKSAARSDV